MGSAAHSHIDVGGGHRAELLSWLPATQPRAVVQIAHGMGEHAARYERVARALVAAGHAVYANHHRGHGPGAAAAGMLGDFGPGGFAAVVADMAQVSQHARAQHPGVPLLLLAHSMGSFAAQLYLLDHVRLVSGVALSGTAATELRFANRDPNRKLQDMNARIEQPRTPFDWLSRDAREVDAYIADPLCGFTITPASRQSMLAACDRLAALDAFVALPKDLPMILITGESRSGQQPSGVVSSAGAATSRCGLARCADAHLSRRAARGVQRDQPRRGDGRPADVGGAGHRQRVTRAASGCRTSSESGR